MNSEFINIDERYGDEYPVIIQDYLDINPEGDFEVVGDEIRELYNEEWFRYHQDIASSRNITMTGNFTGYVVVARLLMSKKIKVTLTAEFAEAVKAYQEAHGIKTLAKAIAQLAAIGYESISGKTAPTPTNEHGGWRGNPKSLENLIGYIDELTDYGRNDPAESD